ncbi:hypothetical protein MHYP_G00177570 [Metynnis hypsauchen]
MEELSTDKYKSSHTTVSDGHYTFKMPSVKKGTTEEDAKSSPDVWLKARNNSGVGQQKEKSIRDYLIKKRGFLASVFSISEERNYSQA